MVNQNKIFSFKIKHQAKKKKKQQQQTPPPPPKKKKNNKKTTKNKKQKKTPKNNNNNNKKKNNNNTQTIFPSDFERTVTFLPIYGLYETSDAACRFQANKFSCLQILLSNTLRAVSFSSCLVELKPRFGLFLAENTIRNFISYHIHECNIIFIALFYIISSSVLISW